MIPVAVEKAAEWALVLLQLVILLVGKEKAQELLSSQAIDDANSLADTIERARGLV